MTAAARWFVPQNVSQWKRIPDCEAEVGDCHSVDYEQVCTTQVAVAGIECPEGCGSLPQPLTKKWSWRSVQCTLA